MADKKYVMGLFSNEDRAVSAVQALEHTQWKVENIHSPFPVNALQNSIHHKKSRVGYFTLAGGISGFIFGFALAVFTAVRWGLIVSGKPVVAYVPFFIVSFEMTILFAVFGNVIGFITQARMPEFRMPDYYDPRCSGYHFGILVSCHEEDEQKVTEFFIARGGIVEREADRS